MYINKPIYSVELFRRRLLSGSGVSTNQYIQLNSLEEDCLVDTVCQERDILSGTILLFGRRQQS